MDKSYYKGLLRSIYRARKWIIVRKGVIVLVDIQSMVLLDANGTWPQRGRGVNTAILSQNGISECRSYNRTIYTSNSLPSFLIHCSLLILFKCPITSLRSPQRPRKTSMRNSSASTPLSSIHTASCSTTMTWLFRLSPSLPTRKPT